ncbi:MAG: histidinol-phosphatase HisJ family protein [Oscillospiraceae bacterium]|jgi:histidinol-phosphatase (PHP family)|nr:histidinol-phosphatase HisJ family protein [Oscillospiraceae bacterium]
MRADYHLHSHHSSDAQPTVAEICQAAQAAGLAEICVTDHIDPHHPKPECAALLNFPALLGEIHAAREAFAGLGLGVKVGLEIGDNAPYRQEIYGILDALPLDFRLLSLHLVDGIDPYEPAYFAGRTQAVAYTAYVQAKLESVLHFQDYDALAHLGYCGKFAPYPPQTRPLRWRHAPDHLDVLLRRLAVDGKALEINTSGLRQTDSPIPGWDILRRFAQLGGEFVTLGSDAHRAQDVGYRLAEGARVALSAGLRWGVTFTCRKPIPYTLEE